MQPGFYTAAELSGERYHSGPGVSNSGLKLLGDKTPLHYWSRYIDPNRRPSSGSQPMFIGTALHAAVLEPDAFARTYVECPFSDKRSAGYKAWAKEQADEGLLVLMPDEALNVTGMRRSLWNDQTVRGLLSDVYEFEYSAYAIDPETGVLVRIRMDALTQSGWIVDLKKTQDASPAAVARSVAKFGYHHQDAFYTDVLGWACGEPPAGFVFVFVEELPPHAVGVYVLIPEDRDRGRRLYRRNLNLYARCLERGEWPGYGGQAQYLELPYWSRREIDSLTLTPENLP